jgi:hypothetical protein
MSGAGASVRFGRTIREQGGVGKPAIRYRVAANAAPRLKNSANGRYCRRPLRPCHPASVRPRRLNLKNRAA